MGPRTEPCVTPLITSCQLDDLTLSQGGGGRGGGRKGGGKGEQEEEE